MYRLVTKCTTKNEVRKLEKRHKCLCACESKSHGSFVNNDTVTAVNGVTAACADCGLRTQIRSNCWIRGLTANGFFYSEVEMLRSQRIALKYCMQYDRLPQQ